MVEHAIEVTRLSRRFGKTLALDEISLHMEPGRVYGLVGAKGQGKTTLIKHLLGLLRAQQGSVRVFGLDPVQNPVEVLQRIGYLSEERDLPDWMRIDELLRYTAAYYPNWSQDYAQELLTTFRLNERKKIKELSKGMRAQAGLIAAVSHRPDLLLLDEPSTGLDPVVRKDILNAIIRAVADDGRTAIFSSHLLDEVEMMSDYVFMIDQGRLVMEGELDSIKERHWLVEAKFPSGFTAAEDIEGVLAAENTTGSWIMICEGEEASIATAIGAQDGTLVKSRTASLQEIFVARVGRHQQHVKNH